MQVRSDFRIRSASAPAKLQTPHTTEPPHPLEAATARWHNAVQGAQAQVDTGLVAHLAMYAHGDTTPLDLTAHGEAMRPLSPAGQAALDELMAAAASVRRARGSAPTHLVLPPSLRALPPWVRHFDALTELVVPNFCGRLLDARGLPRLQRLDLGQTVPRDQKLRLPPGCELQLALPDLRAAKAKVVLHRNHQTHELRWRPLNFNGRVDRDNGKEKYVCRHLSLEKIRLWADELLRPSFMEPGANPMGSLSAIAQNVTPDTEHLAACLDHRPRTAYLVAHSQWGGFARHQFEQMKLDGRHVATAFVGLSNVHAMAMRFDATPPGEPQIECWDPNFTDISAISRAPFDFETLFHDFDRVKEPYFGGEKQLFGSSPHIKITLIDNPLDPMGSVAPTAERCGVSVAFAGLPGVLHPELVREFVEHGFCPEGMNQVTAALENAPLTKQQCLDLLLAADSHRYPALHRAVDRGHGRAHTATAQLLLPAFRRGLIKEADVRFVMEGRGTLSTAMCAAYQNGNHAAITDFGSAVKNLFREGALAEHSVYHLVRGAHTDRTSTVYRIKDLKTAKALEKVLKSLRAAGALGSEHHKDLRDEVKEARESLLQAKKEQKRQAKARPITDPASRV